MVYRFAVQGQFVLAVTFGVLNLLLVCWVSPWRRGKSLTRAEVVALPANECRVDGNETVPTVVMDGRTVTNPDPEIVMSRLTA